MTGFFGVEFDEAFKEDQANIFTDDLWKSSCTSNPSIRPEIDLIWVLSGRSTFLRKNADLLPRAFDDYDDMYRVMKGVEIAQKVNALRARKKVEDLQAEDCVTPILYNGRLIHNEDLRTAFALGKIKYPRNLFIILPIDPENTIGQLRSFKEYITDNAHQNVAVVSSAYHIPRVSRIIGNDSPQTESETAVDHPIRNLNFFLFGVHKNERRRGIIHDIQGEASAMAQYSSSENPSIARTQSRNTFFTDADFAMRRSFHHACNPIPIKGIYQFAIRNSKLPCTIKLMTDPGEIDQDAARTVLIRSFSEEYRQYLNPDQVDRSLTKWTGSGASVEQYYKDYFATEFAEFSSGHLDVWIEARIGSKLVGWATFQLEKSDDPLKLDSAYMNLLIVDPAHQKLSIGKNLVYSIMRLGIMTDLDAINVLVRKTNQAGGRFYRSLDFQANPQYQRDNFVDLSLLEPISLDNPVLPEKEETRLRFR